MSKSVDVNCVCKEDSALIVKGRRGAPLGWCLLPVWCGFWASLVAQTVRNPPAMWEAWVRSLGWEDSLEEGMAAHSSILAWRTPWTEKPGGLQSTGSQRAGHDWVTKQSTALGSLGAESLSPWVSEVSTPEQCGHSLGVFAAMVTGTLEWNPGSNSNSFRKWNFEYLIFQ